MKCIQSHSKDPFFNLAAEEYLLKNYQDDFYFQYINSPSVVIGKHQNALAEIDLNYLEQEGIVLARRISGGGAVYHDSGNVNYSFITNESPGDFIKFKKYTAPVIEALGRLGLSASMGKRNEILLGEEKISGTASHVYKTRVIHHGTLLFNADLDKLEKCLYANSDSYRDKAVKSVRSKVVNISTCLKEEMEASDFYHFLFTSICSGFETEAESQFSDADMKGIGQLMDEKFNLWEWNFGYSPKFELERILELEGGIVRCRTTVEKGHIAAIHFAETHAPFHAVQLNKLLVGKLHKKKYVKQVLLEADLELEVVQLVLKVLF